MILIFYGKMKILLEGYFLKIRTKFKLIYRDFKLIFKRTHKNKFDYIFSLGYNCEIAFRLYEYFKFEESNFLNWTFCESINDLICALNNFEKIASGDFIEPNPLWVCKNTNIGFHGKENMWKYINKTINEQEKNADKKDLIERIAYLKSKFLTLAKSNCKKLYVYKIKNNDLNNDILKKVNELNKTLTDLGTINFKLLIIYEEKNKKFFENFSDKLSENIIFRSVDFYAPDECVTDKSYMNNGFDKIWDEFYCSYKTKNKKKYKFQN